MTLASPTLVAPAGRTRLHRTLAAAALGSLVLCASAKVQIPLHPVPQTMQTFVVVVLGSVLGWRAGALAVALYLVEGAAGWPVFAGTPERGLGLAYMVGPTGGYLVGYALAAAACGWLAEHGRTRSILASAASAALGTALVYGVGVAWLGTLVGWDKPVLAWGVTPFLLGEVAKIALASSLLPTLTRRAARRR